jgi:NADH-quinone oxidoreductase subunit E
MDFIASYLGMPPIAVYEVATFYEMYDTELTGRHKLAICTNLPCALQGAAKAAKHLKEKLGIDFGETTADGQFTLKQGECFGACGDAPVMLVNNKHMCSWMSDEKIDEPRGPAGSGQPVNAGGIPGLYGPDAIITRRIERE